MRRIWGAALAAAVVLFLSGEAVVSPDPALAAAAATTKPSSSGVVYLLRGGLNIFSTGMDELAVKLRARGIEARSEGFSDWPKLAAEARARYAKTHLPIVIVGHSFGANGAIVMATDLNKSRTPIALIILYDTVSSVKVPANVRHVIDFMSTTGQGTGITVTGEYNFAGRINTINVLEDHLSMDNASQLHKDSIAAILKVIRAGKPRTAAQ